MEDIQYKGQEHQPTQSTFAPPAPCPSNSPPTLFPNPPCRPLHKSIHKEAHRDKTAGRVLRWKRRDKKGKGKEIFDPMWEDRRLFKHAEWLGNARVSNRKRDEYLRMNHNELPWNRAADFLRDVDKLPHGPDWKRRVVPDPTGKLVDFWTHDPIKVIRDLMSNPCFVDYMRYAPVQDWTSSSCKKRLYNEVWTGNRWWRLQNALGSRRGATIAMVILLSDKTQLSLMRGNQQAWPVYLTLGNISKSLSRLSSRQLRKAI